MKNYFNEAKLMRYNKLYSNFFLIVFLATCGTTGSVKAIPAVAKKILNNGLTILVHKTNNLQRVAIQIWYNAGAKHEQKSGENGLAHGLEHMTFKGTAELLSESDIPMITHKLSGYANATTSYDWTRYLFNFPIDVWQEALPILADCMRNCTMKEDILNAELKVVIQELKMNKDNYKRALMMQLLSTIFADHPYHHPTIGYKHDLWNMSQDTLLAFYKKHYVPNNATLVVVGNVEPEQVFDMAEKYFGSIPASQDYEEKQFYLTQDISSHTITLYRDVQRPHVMLAFLVPGLKNMPHMHVYDILELLLTRGKESRLHKKLIDDSDLITSLYSFNLGLFDHDLFVIGYEPKNINDNDEIIRLINDEIDTLLTDISQADLARACKIIKHDLYNLLENNYEQATIIGQTFLATKNENYIFTDQLTNIEEIHNALKEVISLDLRPTHMHKALLLPLPDDEKEHWQSLQEKSDQEDTAILSQRIRQSNVEEGKYVHSISVPEPKAHDVSHPQKTVLTNGVKFLYHSTQTPTITLILDLKAHGHYDSDILPGLYRMVCNYIPEGTENYTDEQLAHEFESRAISLSINPGDISMNMLSEDLPKALELLEEVLTKATFPQESLSKMRGWALASYHHFLDSAAARASERIAQHLYRGHPFAKDTIGNEETISKITHQDIVQFYKKYFSPDQARLSIVGDLSNYDIVSLVEKTLGSWQGPAVEDLIYPELESVNKEILIEPINRDQIVLGFAGLSITRIDPDFDKLLIFDHIFSRGMSSRLFQLRQESGAFYSISGSLVEGASLERGIVHVSTIVSKDRLDEAINLITKTIDQAVDTITQEEIDEAKRMIINNGYSAYDTNHQQAGTFLFLDDYNLPDDYFKYRKNYLDTITIDDVKTAVRKVLRSDSMIIIKAGRVSDYKNSENE